MTNPEDEDQMEQDEAPNPPSERGRGRPKKPPLDQVTIYDRWLDDKRLGDLMKEAYETAPIADRHRNTRKEIKARIEQLHTHLIVEPDEDGNWPFDEDAPEVGEGPFVIVTASDGSTFRFEAKRAPRPEKSVTIKKGKDWKFESARVANAAPPNLPLGR